MSKGRLEAFSDGVLAIIITIMVLELKAPAHAARLADLAPLWPVFLSYVLSFLYVGIYWNNHHHLLHAAGRIGARVMWANLHLLFWLSLIPFVTAWAGENRFGPMPAALYGAVLFMASIAYWILQGLILRRAGQDSALARALGADLKGKASMVLYAIAIPAAFFERGVSWAVYLVVALVWLVPDQRIARAIEASEP